MYLILPAFWKLKGLQSNWMKSWWFVCVLQRFGRKYCRNPIWTFKWVGKRLINDKIDQIQALPNEPAAWTGHKELSDRLRKGTFQETQQPCSRGRTCGRLCTGYPEGSCGLEDGRWNTPERWRREADDQCVFSNGYRCDGCPTAAWWPIRSSWWHSEHVPGWHWWWRCHFECTGGEDQRSSLGVEKSHQRRTSRGPALNIWIEGCRQLTRMIKGVAAQCTQIRETSSMAQERVLADHVREMFISSDNKIQYDMGIICSYVEDFVVQTYVKRGIYEVDKPLPWIRKLGNLFVALQEAYLFVEWNMYCCELLQVLPPALAQHKFELSTRLQEVLQRAEHLLQDWESKINVIASDLSRSVLRCQNVFAREILRHRHELFWQLCLAEPQNRVRN